MEFLKPLAEVALVFVVPSLIMRRMNRIAAASLGLDEADAVAADIVRAMIIVVGDESQMEESDRALILARVYGFCGDDRDGVLRFL